MFFVFSGGIYCNATWDRMQCWGYTKAGETVYQPCPHYITLSNPLGTILHYAMHFICFFFIFCSRYICCIKYGYKNKIVTRSFLSFYICYIYVYIYIIFVFVCLQMELQME